MNQTVPPTPLVFFVVLWIFNLDILHGSLQNPDCLQISRSSSAGNEVVGDNSSSLIGEYYDCYFKLCFCLQGFWTIFLFFTWYLWYLISIILWAIEPPSYYINPKVTIQYRAVTSLQRSMKFRIVVFSENNNAKLRILVAKSSSCVEAMMVTSQASCNRHGFYSTRRHNNKNRARRTNKAKLSARKKGSIISHLQYVPVDIIILLTEKFKETPYRNNVTDSQWNPRAKELEVDRW